MSFSLYCSFRLSTSKDRCSIDEGGRCQFVIDIYSLLYSVHIQSESGHKNPTCQDVADATVYVRLLFAYTTSGPETSTDTVASAPFMTGLVLKQRFRISLGQC